jgi:dienelactone hydrolase
VVSAAAIASSAAQVPLPDDLSVGPVSPEVPSTIAAFAGAWGPASWDGVLPHVLVVEHVDASGRVIAVYAIGANEVRHIKPEWQRLEGHIEGGKLILASTRVTLVYEMMAGRELFGRYQSSAGEIATIRMRRLPASDAASVIGAAGQPIKPDWKEIQIEEHAKVGAAAGQVISLRASLYRIPGEGRQPLVIFNHGSTDHTTVGAVSHFAPQALIFQSLGWDVIVPMRKGRGGSGGPMLEPSDRSVPDSEQLESGVEDLDAVVGFAKAQPYVDPRRIVVAGQSRGGMLAVVYAGRHPENVAGVVNFAGGWWSERYDADFNTRRFSEAGHYAKVRMLWLYAAHDSYYSLDHVRRNFAAFKAAGGRGSLFETDQLSGNGHALLAWPELWQQPVARFLADVSAGG